MRKSYARYRKRPRMRYLSRVHRSQETQGLRRKLKGFHTASVPHFQGLGAQVLKRKIEVRHAAPYTTFPRVRDSMVENKNRGGLHCPLYRISSTSPIYACVCVGGLVCVQRLSFSFFFFFYVSSLTRTAALVSAELWQGGHLGSKECSPCRISPLRLSCNLSGSCKRRPRNTFLRTATRSQLIKRESLRSFFLLLSLLVATALHNRPLDLSFFISFHSIYLEGLCG